MMFPILVRQQPDSVILNVTAPIRSLKLAYGLSMGELLIQQSRKLIDWIVGDIKYRAAFSIFVRGPERELILDHASIREVSGGVIGKVERELARQSVTVGQ